jgi:hypothetical protein
LVKILDKNVPLQNLYTNFSVKLLDLDLHHTIPKEGIWKNAKKMEIQKGKSKLQKYQNAKLNG